jgi:hypothetical protein
LQEGYSLLGGFQPQRLKLMLCKMVSTFAGEDDAELRAASYLKGWVDTGMLAGFQLQ